MEEKILLDVITELQREGFEGAAKLTKTGDLWNPSKGAKTKIMDYVCYLKTKLHTIPLNY